MMQLEVNPYNLAWLRDSQESGVFTDWPAHGYTCVVWKFISTPKAAIEALTKVLEDQVLRKELQDKTKAVTVAIEALTAAIEALTKVLEDQVLRKHLQDNH